MKLIENQVWNNVAESRDLKDWLEEKYKLLQSFWKASCYIESFKNMILDLESLIPAINYKEMI
jgi:hypothetical protein